jgi:hypothetical protein
MLFGKFGHIQKPIIFPYFFQFINGLGSVLSFGCDIIGDNFDGLAGQGGVYAFGVFGDT